VGETRTHKDLEVWKRAVDFVVDIYAITRYFPKEELYGLTSQMRRCAVSIPSNISEGAARNHNNEFIQFLYIALGSAAEIETQIIISLKLKYINEETSTNLLSEINTISRMLQGLLKSLKKNNPMSNEQ
jgi:four helix bundle protein